MNKCIALVGNGSYRNRGCEAILRGTLVSLRTEFGRDINIQAGSYASEEALQEQNRFETDSAVQTIPLRISRARFSQDWFAHQFNKYLRTSFAGVHAPLLQFIAQRPIAALSLGGDNYSLDYGMPGHFLEMDRFLLTRGVPVFIWGASIGPFDANPQFETDIAEHLRCVTGIFVRESLSRDYLAKIGVEENVRLVADPAFLMKSEPINTEALSQLASRCPIGVNLSPLIGKKYLPRSCMPWEIKKADLQPFINFCSEFVESLSRQFDNPIALVPHVTSDSVGSDDLYLMREVLERLPTQTSQRVHMLPSNLRAAELKWFIGQCRLFIGARTHSTIAAFGSTVPTLTLGYSLKARGLNEDILGTHEFCISAQSLTHEQLKDGVTRLAKEESTIRRHLEKTIPQVQNKAQLATNYLNAMTACSKPRSHR